MLQKTSGLCQSGIAYMIFAITLTLIQKKTFKGPKDLGQYKSSGKKQVITEKTRRGRPR